MQQMHSSSGNARPLEELAATSATTVKKSAFAAIVGLSPGRVSQMLKMGLPVEVNGKIDVARGKVWIAENIDPNLSASQRDPDAQLPIFSLPKRGGRNEKNELDIERSKLELERMRGSLVDKAGVERAVFARARGERDAWANWPLRVVGEMAAELGLDEAVLLPVLKRHVRENLTRLSETDHVALAG